MKLIDPDTVPGPAFVLSQKYAAFEGPWHSHRRAQFVYASEGLLTTRTRTGLWVVPPGRGVWLVPGEVHSGSSPAGCWLRTLYADPDAAPVPARSCVVSVDRLLDALLVEAASFGADSPPGAAEQRLLAVILDRLSMLAVFPSFLPMPEDPRLMRLTATLEREPADDRTLEALASQSGMSARTAARLFVRETGLTFAQWRQQLRLLAALRAMGLGASVTRAAADVGYADVSAFIDVFRKALGETPAKYMKSNRWPSA